MILVRFEIRGYGFWMDQMESNAPGNLAKSIRAKAFFKHIGGQLKFEPVMGTNDAAWIVRVGNIMGSPIEDLIGRCQWRQEPVAPPP